MIDKPGTTVLVVDNVPENVTLVSRILEINGYHIVTADNGEKALKIAKTSHPDVILLAINMPIMNGFDTCARLKEDQATQKIPVIFISGMGDAKEKAKGFQFGATDYILKPFDDKEVLTRVETQLILRHLHLQLEQANQELSAREQELTISNERLAERERRLNAFRNALPNTSFIMDEEGRYVEIIADQVGLSDTRPNELMGRLVKDVLPPKEGEKILVAIRQTIQTGETKVIEYKIPILDGSEQWFEGRIALIEKNDPGKSKVFLMAKDITERVQLYQEVQRSADLDFLTNCFNKRHFMELAKQEIQRAIRYKRPLSFLIMDIDHFKRFNNQYGHKAGNQLLCHLVDLCKSQLRNIDVLGRFGGEEFAALMPETGKLGAMLASERLRNKIAQMKVNTDAGELAITVSIGLASLDKGFEENQTVDSLIKSVEKALSAAKVAGRNCIRVA
jgi:two-component system cell cycle response regulator